MPLSRTKTWIAGEVLTASDLNAEFNNILNNSASLVFPVSGNLTWQSGSAFTATFDHNISADRTYTFPDESISVVGTTTTQSLTFKSFPSGLKSASGASASTASGSPVTLFAASSAGMYLVTTYIVDAGAANYTATAIVLNDGTNARIINTSNGASLTLTLSGTNVQSTQSSGSAAVMTYTYLWIATF
jgi:hypothetical protein